jgi:hypothetical protein
VRRASAWPPRVLPRLRALTLGPDAEVADLLDRITELETLLRIRGRTEPVHTPPDQPTSTDQEPTNQEKSPEWT